MSNPVVTIELENGQVMKGELYPDKAPNTVNNFIALSNSGYSENNAVHSIEVVLTEDGKITRNGSSVGSWLMYGDGYIKLTFDSVTVLSDHAQVELTYYGVVRPAWLYEQDKSGFTITAMGQTGLTRNCALFMNNISTVGD